MDDTVCPRCGYQFNSQQSKIENLNASTRHVWDSVGLRWQHGNELLGTHVIAARCNLSETAIRWHLSILVSEGLVQRIPKNPQAGRRHLYTGTLIHNHAEKNSATIA